MRPLAPVPAHAAPCSIRIAARAGVLASNCTAIGVCFFAQLSSGRRAAHGADATVKLLRCGRIFLEGLYLSYRPVRYGMIVLDAVPSIVRVRGAPIIFHSPDETVEYARLHDVQRWMVYGDPEGWWPLYTQDGPVNPPPEPRARVDISLHR